MRKFLMSGAVILCAFAFPAFAAEKTAAPELSGLWQHTVPQEEWENPPSGPGPVRKMTDTEDLDPTHNAWMGDYRNPILLPWTAEAVKKEGEHEAAGGIAMTGQLTCRPSGVPAVFTVLAPVQIVQSPKVVLFLYQRDHQVRIVRMNAKHPAKLDPSYYGDSIGHYEGDTLVVDTVGMNDRTWTDRFGTPHTEALHVVEHYGITNGGKTLRDFFTVEDKGAFATPWSAVLNYSRSRQTAIEEEVCAENNRGLPVPVADVDPVSGRKLTGDPP